MMMLLMSLTLMLIELRRDDDMATMVKFRRWEAK